MREASQPKCAINSVEIPLATLESMRSGAPFLPASKNSLESICGISSFIGSM